MKSLNPAATRPIHFAHRISMRAQMTLVLALSIGCLVIGASVAYHLYTRQSLEDGFAASLDSMAQASAKLARHKGSLDDLEEQIEVHNREVEMGGAIPENVEAWLRDPKGKLIWRFAAPRRPRYDHGPDDDRGPDGAGGPHGNRDDHGAHHDPIGPPLSANFVPPLDHPEDWRTRTVPWHGNTLILGLPWFRARHDLAGQTYALTALCLLITTGAAAGGYLLVGRTLRPINSLAEQAHASLQDPARLLSSQTVPPLQPTSSDREMQVLVATLNELLGGMKEAAISKERFHASASHELRTPLQALSGHLGVALSRDRSATEYKLALEEAAQQTARLSKLTSDLLLLNRLQTAAALPRGEDVDIAEMCDIALQRAEKTISARELRLVTNWEPLEICAPPSYVEIMLGNLVENAAKYTRAGGSMGVEILPQSRTVRVWNECEKADWETLKREVPRLTEAFYRPDSARSAETGGNGLGLAICQAIALANGWELKIETQGEVFRVEVEF